MTARMRACAIAILATVAAGSGLAGERPVQLKNALGLDKVEAHCGACHSLDYIVMNSPFLTAAAWNAEVAKMINAFGAPIDKADAETITTYLGANYSADRHVSAQKRAARRERSSVHSRRDAEAWRHYSEPSSGARRKRSNVQSRRDAEAWRYYSEPYSGAQ